MAPVLSKYVSQKNAIIGGAVAGVPLVIFLLKKYALNNKKTIKRYIQNHNNENIYIYVL